MMSERSRHVSITQNHKILYLFLIFIIIFALFYTSIVRQKDNGLQTITPTETNLEIKSFCLSNTTKLRCVLIIENQYKNTIYINYIKMQYNGASLDINLEKTGIVIEPYTYSILNINVGKSYVIVRQISYEKNISIYLATASYPLIEKLTKIEYNYKIIYNISKINILAPQSGIIVPIDYELNLTRSTYVSLINITTNVSANLMYDLKVFLWNDVLYYEKISHLEESSIILLPIPSTNIPQADISRITLNILNNDYKYVNVSVTALIIETPNIKVELDYIGGETILATPVVCEKSIIGIMNDLFVKQHQPS